MTMDVNYPKHMTEDEVAEKWDEYIEMDEDLTERFGLTERDVEPMTKEEMGELNMVFVGMTPVIFPGKHDGPQ